MKKSLAILLALIMMLTMVSAAFAEGGAGESGTAEAKIGDAMYSTFDEAAAAAKNGDTIELLADCESKNGIGICGTKLTVKGNNHTLKMNSRGIYVVKSDNVPGELTFENCSVELAPQNGTPKVRGEEYGWAAVVINYDCVLSFNNCTLVNIEPAGSVNTGVYYHEGSKVNLTNTVMKVSGFSGNAFSADVKDEGKPYTSELNVLEKSKLTVSDSRAGITAAMKITVENSLLNNSCNSGNASNGADYILKNAMVDVSKNGSHGMSARNITIINKSTVTCNENGFYGITAYGEVSIDGTSSVTANGNATKEKCGGVRFTQSAKAVIESDAVVEITQNHRNGLENYGTCTFKEGAKLTVMKNSEKNNGGGVYNEGTLVLPQNAKIYNNHAAKAGDDIYNAEGASITFGNVGSNWILDDCNHTINGWYDDDAEERRWNSTYDGKPCIDGRADHAARVSAGKIEGMRALKAAHDAQTTPPEPTPTPYTPHHHYDPVPVVVVVPPKTGDMPLWYGIARFLNLVK